MSTTSVAKPAVPGLLATTTTHTDDLARNLTATKDPLGRATRFDYDAKNRRVRMLHPDDTAKTFAYDALDRMIAETNELGHTTKRTYDAYGNLVALTDPAGGTTQYLFGASEAP